MSIEMHGWLGGDTYGKREYEKGVWIPAKHVNPCPYPIGLGSDILIPSGWTLGNFGHTYKIPRWGLRPYGPFISNYYSNLGWCYQRRRTWHGITHSPMRPPISKNKHTSKQTGRQWLFYNAVKAWQDFAQNEKDVYNRWRYPARASGYNRFIRWFMRLGPTMPLYWGNLQRSDSDPTLVEDAAVLQHDPHIHYPFQFYNMQAFNMVLHKGGGFPADPVSGQLFYRSDLDKIYKWDGAAWEEVGAGAGGENYYSPTVIVATDATGDYSDIQTAINALPAGGGRVFVKEGTYNLAAKLVILLSNVTLQGQGASTILHLDNTVNQSVLEIGNGADAYTDIVIRDLKIEGNSANQTGGYGIHARVASDKIQILNCLISDTKWAGIYLEGGLTRPVVRGNRIENCKRNGLLLGSTDGGVFSENAFIDNGDASYMQLLSWNGKRSTITNNTFKHDGGANSAHGIRFNDGYENVIVNNHFNGCNVAVYMAYSFIGIYRNTISDNAIVDSYGTSIYTGGVEDIVSGNTINLAGGHGIEAWNNGGVVNGNTITDTIKNPIYVGGSGIVISGNNLSKSMQEAIVVVGGCINIVSDNYVYQAALPAANFYTGIYIKEFFGTPATDNNIFGNVVAGLSYGNKFKTGIGEEAATCDRNFISKNRTLNIQTQDILRQGPSSVAFENFFVGANVGLTLLKTTANQTINAGAATFVDITGLTFPVVNGVDYAFHFYITFQSAAAATGWKSGVNHPGGTLDFWAQSEVIANGPAGVATHTERHNTAVDDMTLLTATVTQAVDLAIRIEGRYKCTANGIFAARFANELNANTDIVVQKGSWGWYF